MTTVENASLKPTRYCNNRVIVTLNFFFGALHFSNTFPYGSKITLQHCGSIKFYVHVILLPLTVMQKKKTSHELPSSFNHLHTINTKAENYLLLIFKSRQLLYSTYDPWFYMVMAFIPHRSMPMDWNNLSSPSQAYGKHCVEVVPHHYSKSRCLFRYNHWMINL